MDKELERFRLKNGVDLSAYALACGYVQRRAVSTDVDIVLWHEGACFHVRAHDYTAGRRVFWFSTMRLTDARRVYKSGRPPVHGFTG